MLSMPISSSFSETGCSTFSLANFFPFSTSSLLSFSKCSRNLNNEGKGQASRHAYNNTDVAVHVKWKVLGVTILFISDQVNLILTIMSRTPHRRTPNNCPPLWPCSCCRQIWAQFWSWSSTAADYRWPNQCVSIRLHGQVRPHWSGNQIGIWLETAFSSSWVLLGTIWFRTFTTTDTIQMGHK